MELEYYISKVSLNNKLYLEDLYLTPLRWLMDGKTYRIIDPLRESRWVHLQIINSNETQPHIYKSYSSSKWIAVAKKIIALVTLPLTFISIIVGVILKECNSDYKRNYCFIKNCGSKIYIVIEEALALKPKKILPSAREKEGIDEVEIEELIKMWRETGPVNISKEGIYNFRSVELGLKEWIGKIHQENVGFIRHKKEAMAYLEKTLKFIILKLRSADPSKKRLVIKNLYESSKVCAPTWIETAGQELLSLSEGGGGKEKLLRYLRLYKEQGISDQVSFSQQGQWHILNNFRKKVGNKLGLSKISSDFDGAATMYNDLSKSECLAIFRLIFKPTDILDFLKNMLKAEANERGYDEDMGIYLRDILDKLFQSDLLDQKLKEEYDEDDGLFVCKYFFDTDKSKISLNQRAIALMLMDIGIFDKNYSLIF